MEFDTSTIVLTMKSKLIAPRNKLLTTNLSRRVFVEKSLTYYAALLSMPVISSCSEVGGHSKIVSNLTSLGPLQSADQYGCRLPAGFKCRIIARSSSPVTPDSNFNWHGAPDGGACFADGVGWIYVSNSELSAGNGGVSAINFDSSGTIVDAYSILSNTSRNCAGGSTPYGTWLSCEETGESGRVFECDPTGTAEAIERPALGYFNHEAVAYDTDKHTLYLTEDRPDGKLYRFTAANLTTNGYADLSAGQLEVAEIVKSGLTDTMVWHHIADPLAIALPTRYQVTESSPFNGGEGIVYINGLLAFTTKGDNKVWQYNTLSGSIEVIYDDDTSSNPILTHVDNITANFAGEYLVAEDGGDMQLIILTKSGEVKPLLSLEGQELSEITGPAFSPDGSRLYLSSQRGVTGHSADGITYEITGPFFSEV